MLITGIHHITLVTKNASRNIAFYTQVLGQRLVKKTVNFDAPQSYHLYFGDEIASNKRVVTVIERTKTIATDFTE